MTAHALPSNARRRWKKFLAVRFISPAEEDATLAALERRAQKMLVEHPQQRGPAPRPCPKSERPR
jgi:hypothetical protein